MGGGGSESAQVEKFTPPEWTVPGWQAGVQGAMDYASRPQETYDGMTQAPLNPYHTGYANMVEQQASEGSPDLNAARGASLNFSTGQMMNPMTQQLMDASGATNPYASALGNAAGGVNNPWAAAMAGSSAQSNPYLSDQYTGEMINQTADQMAKAYSTGAAAQTDALANQAGGWGGGGWQAMHDAGQQNLSQDIGKMTSGMLQQQQQYKGGLFAQDRAAQMAGAQGAGGMYGQDAGLRLQGLQGAGGLTSTDQAQRLQALQGAGGLFQGDMGNILNAGQAANQYRQDDWTSANALKGVGDMFQKYQQGLLGSQYQQWQDQQNDPLKRLDTLFGALGKASGVSGSSMASTTGPGINPLMAALGIGATAYGLTP